MTEEGLLSMGFVKGELSLKYHLARKRFISVFCVGTPNEVVYLCYKDSVDVVDDLICVHNFDYDGKLTISKVKHLLEFFTTTESAWFVRDFNSVLQEL